MRRLFAGNALVTSFLTISFLSVVDAQAPRVSSAERRVDLLNRQGKLSDLENMGRAKKEGPDAKRTRQIRLEIEEDFSRLQAAYNVVLVAVQSKEELAADFPRKWGPTIRKHADRLKANLALPQLAEEEPKKADLPPARPDKKILRALCKGIYDFITNPIFEPAASLDVVNASKARRDLELIIYLSTEIAAH